MSRGPNPFRLPKPFRRRPQSFICPSCTLPAPSTRLLSTQLPPRTTNRLPFQPHLRSTIASSSAQHRSASITASPTTINATVSIPTAHQALYAALDRLRTDAGPYVNKNRLELVLKGLETDEQVIKVAILALNEDTSEARKLVRCLLADPLGGVEEWEEVLDGELGEGKESLTTDVQDRNVLVRYGEKKGFDIGGQDEGPFRTVLASSRVLKRDNLEILIASLPVIGNEKDALSTILEAKTVGSKGSLVTYPVHRAVVLANGLKGAQEYGRLMASVQNTPEDLVTLAVSLPAVPESMRQRQQDGSVDVGLASAALGKIRKDVANAMDYEHDWLRSGISPISAWLTPESSERQATETVNPAVKSLIASILSAARFSILSESTAILTRQTQQTIAASTKRSISSALATWAEHAHMELRDNLDLAFSGRHWRKLKWWKLFWRVDDVGAIASDILERRWLTNAEKEIIYVAGRLEEAGFTDSSNGAGWLNFRPTPVPQAALSADAGDILQARPVAFKRAKKHGQDNGEVLPPKLAPWPQQIPLLRTDIATSSIPYLQSLAQTLLLQTFSTSALSAALSALTYVSFSSFGLLEAGAIGALGITYSLRRMQHKWETARELWEGELREEGRKVLKGMQESVTELIEAEGRKEVVSEGEETRLLATNALDKVEDALQELE